MKAMKVYLLAPSKALTLSVFPQENDSNLLSRKSLHLNKLYKTTSRDKLLLPFYRGTTAPSLCGFCCLFVCFPPTNWISHILKQYRELNSGMLLCRFSATQINVHLNKREVWLNPYHRCPRTPNTQIAILSFMAKRTLQKPKALS